MSCVRTLAKLAAVRATSACDTLMLARDRSLAPSAASRSACELSPRARRSRALARSLSLITRSARARASDALDDASEARASFTRV